MAEAFYTLQLSPMTRFQPDVQVIWNPVFNSDPVLFTVVQAQFLLTW